MINWLKKRQIQAIVIGIWIVVLFMSQIPIWKLVSLIEFDWLTVLTAPTSPNNQIIIIGIDEDSFVELGLQWPWPRHLHARLIERLIEAGAAVIAFDVEFIEPSNPDDDLLFSKAIRNTRNVVLAAHVEHKQTAHVEQWMRIDPLDLFMEAGATPGITNLSLDADTIVRKIPTLRDSFWQEIIAVSGKHGDLPNLSGKLIRYVEPRSFPYVSYYQALDPAKYFKENKFKQQIVLIGRDLMAAPVPERMQADMHASPFFRVTGQLTPGVEIQANIIESVLQNRAITEAPLWNQFLLIFIVASLSLIRLSPWRPARNALITAGFTVTVFAVTISCFTALDYWLPATTSIFGLWLSYIGQEAIAYLQVQSHARFIRKAFERYVSPEIVKYMLENPDRFVLGGERREVTFIFTDLADSTSLCEQLTDAEQLVDLMKNYFEGMGEVILTHNGTIERFAGDGLVAFFNAPVDQPDHAPRAVACAIRLDEFAQSFAASQQVHGIPFGVTRIGVNTGEVTVGNFGSNKYFHYTAIGDSINIAARLESANKYFGSRVCVSSSTVARCNNCDNIAFRPIGEIVFKGKSRAVGVFEPLTEEKLVKPPIAAYQAAYDLLDKQDSMAIAAFEKVLSLDPDDSLAKFHFNRLKNNQLGTKIVLSEK